MLLIAKKDNGYESIVAYNENKDYFEGNFSAAEMQVIYSSALAKTI